MGAAVTNGEPAAGPAVPSEGSAAPARAPVPRGGRAWGATLAGAVAVGSVVWVLHVLAVAGRVPDGDGAHLAAVELRLWELVRTGDLVRAFRQFFALLAPHPPVGYVPGVVGAALFGGSAYGPLAGMGVALLLHAHAYWILFRGRAWAPWLVLLSSPLVWLQVEGHGKDLLASAAVMQMVAWLVASKGFRARGASLAFGGWLAALFLTKYTAPFFAVVPCLGAGLALLLTSRDAARARWANLGRAVGVFAATAGAWLLVYGQRVFAYATYSGGDMTERVGQAGVLHGLDRTLYYPLALRDALGAPGLIALLVGAVLGGWRARDRSSTAYSLLTALGGVALLGSLSYGVDRYATPSVGVLAMLAAPLAGAGAQAGRLWLPVGATLVLAGFAPVLQSSAQRFWPGAPSAPARYNHPASSAAELAWPSTTAYGPSDFNLRAWKIDEAVAALRAVHGRDDGTVGLLLPGGPEVPSYGLVLQRAARLGYRWDVASVNLQWRPGDTISQVFLGPLFDGEWPSGAFTALYAVETPDVAAQARSWLQQQRAEVVTVIPLERGARGVIYRLDFRPAIDRAAEGSAVPAAPR